MLAAWSALVVAPRVVPAGVGVGGCATVVSVVLANGKGVMTSVGGSVSAVCTVRSSSGVCGREAERAVAVALAVAVDVATAVTAGRRRGDRREPPESVRLSLAICRKQRTGRTREELQR